MNIQRILIDFERLFAMENIPVARPGQRPLSSWVGVFAMPVLQRWEQDGNHLGYSPKYKVFTLLEMWQAHNRRGACFLAWVNPKRDAVQYALERYPADAFAALKKKKKKHMNAPMNLELIGSKTPDEVHIRYLSSSHIDTDWLVDRYDARFTQRT